jgi:hypothetical protein
MLTLTVGCATTFDDPGPEALSTVQRTEMGRMAIRGPMTPKVALTGEEVLETKGEAAKSKAAGAAVGWLGGSLQAGAESGDPLGFLLMATIGIVGAPVAAVGGAVYGATAADSAEELESGNQVIATALDFAPQHFQSSLDDALEGVTPVNYAFVDASVTDAALRAEGYDSVVNVTMESIASSASESGLEVSFLSANRLELVSLDDGRVLESRYFEATTPARNVSDWAAESAQPLFDGLGVGFDEMAAEFVEVFFLAPSIRVQGLEPISPSPYRVGRIDTLQPLFLWGALDGNRQIASGADVDYEVMIFPKGEEPGSGERTGATRYVRGEPLVACTRYEWKVRAHYEQFGAAAASEWTPTYRFKTPCEKR